MGNFDIPSILSYGVSGLGFLLAFLTFRLLLNEQKRKAPRKNILHACFIFMIFSLILVGFGFASEFYGNGKTHHIAEKQRTAIENNLRNEIISFFKNQDNQLTMAKSPSVIMGEAKAIIRKLQSDPNTFNNIQMEIEREKK